MVCALKSFLVPRSCGRLLLNAPVLLSTREETDDVVVKLGDFGLSTFVDHEKAPSTYAGTKEYLAPVCISPQLSVITADTIVGNC